MGNLTVWEVVVAIAFPLLVTWATSNMDFSPEQRKRLNWFIGFLWVGAIMLIVRLAES